MQTNSDCVCSLCYRLNQKIVCVSSPVLLRQFLTSIFISVDMSVKEGEQFCDVICDKGPLLQGQVTTQFSPLLHRIADSSDLTE